MGFLIDSSKLVEWNKRQRVMTDGLKIGDGGGRRREIEMRQGKKEKVSMRTVGASGARKTSQTSYFCISISNKIFSFSYK
jgi:hypothetical protein